MAYDGMHRKELLLSKIRTVLPTIAKDAIFAKNANFYDSGNDWEQLNYLLHEKGGYTSYNELQKNLQLQYSSISQKYNLSMTQEERNKLFFINGEPDKDNHWATFYTGLKDFDDNPIYVILTPNSLRTEINKRTGQFFQYWLGYTWATIDDPRVSYAVENGLTCPQFIDNNIGNEEAYSSSDLARIEKIKNTFKNKVPEEFEEFSALFQQDLDKLNNKAREEEWGNNLWIIRNYLINVYKKLAYDYNLSEGNKKSNFILFNKDNNFSCINTGLFDKFGSSIYCVFSQNNKACMQKSNSQKTYFPYWRIFDFVNANNSILRDNFSDNLPQRPYFFDDPAALVFDYRKKIIVSTEHILEDNYDRLPEEIQNLDERFQKKELDSAVDTVIEQLQENYKLAVPQYYPIDHNIQLLLPLRVGTSAVKPNLALVVKYDEKDDVYYGKTCLPLSWAYANARLIVRPEENWLKPPTNDEVTIKQIY